MKRGFTLTEVLVALFLVAVVGGLLLRYLAFSAQVEGASSVRRGLAELARFASWRVISGDPAFIPSSGQQERSYGYGELGPLLAGAGGVNLANPDLYRLRVEAQGEGYVVEVCYRAPQEECLRVGGVASTQGSGSAQVDLRGVLVLTVTAPPALSVVDVRVTGESWLGSITRPGNYALAVPPGDYQVRAGPVEIGGVTYRPEPQAEVVSVAASGRSEARVAYTCEGGVVRYAVTSGFTVSLRGPAYRTLSGSGEAVLPPGEYVLEPQPPSEDYGYEVALVPPSGRFTLAPCSSQEVRADYRPTKGRLVVEGSVEDYRLESGAPRASVTLPGATRADTANLPYSALSDPGDAFVRPLTTQITVGSGTNQYSVTLEPMDSGTRQVQVTAGQESRISLSYRAVPYQTCLYLYDGTYSGAFFTSGTFHLRVSRNGESVKDEQFSLSSCYRFSLPPGVYTLEVERLYDVFRFRGQRSLQASSSSTVQASAVTLYPTRAALATWVYYQRPSTEAGYDGRGGVVSFTAGAEGFARGGSPYGSGQENRVLFSVAPQVGLAFSAQDQVFLGTKRVSGVDYNYYWKLRRVELVDGSPLPSVTPAAGQTLSARVVWALLRCQVAYPSRCQIWTGAWTTYTP